MGTDPVIAAPCCSGRNVSDGAVLDILPNPHIGPFTKEDGEMVIDAQGRRLA